MGFGTYAGGSLSLCASWRKGRRNALELSADVYSWLLIARYIQYLSNYRQTRRMAS